VTGAGSIRERLNTYIREQAAWREEKATEYPDHPRNLRSAEHLKRLAEYVDNSPTTISSCRP
jgi:ribonuclease D